VRKSFPFLTAAASLLLAFQTAAQTPAGRPAAPAAARATAGIPRMADGKPNLNGIWQTMSAADWNLEDHSASASPVVAMGALGAAPAGAGVIEGGGSIPYKPEALEQKKKLAADRMKQDPEVMCYLPGVPRATYIPMPFEITQSNKDILFAYTYDTAARIVHMGKAVKADLDTFMGTNNGHWEGDTLVIDVTSQTGRTWLDRAGDFTTGNLHVVERFTPMDANTMNYEATIEDPTIYTKPWKINLILYKHREKNLRLLDFKCVEFIEDLEYQDLERKK
jgi:hypothetical protein